MKIATIEDTQEVLDMSMKFMSETNYTEFSDEGTIKSFIENIVMSPQNEKIILLEPGVGFLAGWSVPFPFGPHLVGSEIAWYVYPEHRGKSVGTSFLKAFEYWAKEKAGCSMVSMVCLDEGLSKYYNNNGYKLYERAYMKVL